jgi:hypothetical protein
MSETGFDGASPGVAVSETENPFETRWATRAYLQEYYPPLNTERAFVTGVLDAADGMRSQNGKIDLKALAAGVPGLQEQGTEAVENYLILDFSTRAAAEILKTFPDDSLKVLDVAGGPTAYQLFPLATVSESLHTGEYLPANRDEIKKWKDGSSEAYDWGSYSNVTSTIIERHLGAIKSAARQDVYEEIADLQDPDKLIEKTKSKLVAIEPSDVFNPKGATTPSYNAIASIGRHYGAAFMISSFFGPESATNSREQWTKSVQTLVSDKALGPDGYFLMASLNGADSYTVGQEELPAVNLGFEEQKQLLQESGLEVVMAEELIGSDFEKTKYTGMSFFLAKRPGGDKSSNEIAFDEYLKNRNNK